MLDVSNVATEDDAPTLEKLAAEVLENTAEDEAVVVKLTTGVSEDDGSGDSVSNVVVVIASIVLLAETAAAVDIDIEDEGDAARMVDEDTGPVGVSPILTHPDLAVIADGQLTSDHSTLRLCK